MNRRDFLHLSEVAAGGAILAACSSQTANTETTGKTGDVKGSWEPLPPFDQDPNENCLVVPYSTEYRDCVQETDRPAGDLMLIQKAIDSGKMPETQEQATIALGWEKGLTEKNRMGWGRFSQKTDFRQEGAHFTMDPRTEGTGYLEVVVTHPEEGARRVGETALMLAEIKDEKAYRRTHDITERITPEMKMEWRLDQVLCTIIHPPL